MCIYKIQLRSEDVATLFCSELTEKRIKTCRLGSAVVVNVTKYNTNLITGLCHKHRGYTDSANDFDRICYNG